VDWTPRHEKIIAVCGDTLVVRHSYLKYNTPAVSNIGRCQEEMKYYLYKATNVLNYKQSNPSFDG